MDKSFEKTYSLNPARLKIGHNIELFELDGAFFSHFENESIQDCSIKAELEIIRNEFQLDVSFYIHGEVTVACDRCAEDMKLPIALKERVIYSFNEKLKDVDNLEIIFVNEKAPFISIVQELYDFVCIAIPFKKVHEDVGETCNPEIMKYILPDTEEDYISDIEE